jgi:aromatic-L-amino-acid/L-tryptophan decarboxylase
MSEASNYKFWQSSKWIFSKSRPKRRDAVLDIDPEIFRKNGYLLIDEIVALLASIHDRPVAQGEHPSQVKSLLPNGLPMEGTSLEDVLRTSIKLLFNHSVFNGHPRFWGYITSSPAPTAMLADLLAAAVNSNVGAYVLSPMATEIEKQTIGWISQLIGYRQDSTGIFVSGGNMANITALAAARTSKANWNIRQTGFGIRQMLIYASKETHTWINKAADLLGFGLDNIRWIDVDKNQRMKVDALEAQIQADLVSGYYPFIVIGTAGSVSTGVVDPLFEISIVCKKYQLWFHIDGAYGAPAASVPSVAHLFKGLEFADSIALDPHKWLYSPLEAACTIVKDPNALRDAFSFKPAYYNFDGKPDDPALNFLDMGFQNSRGFRALKVWMSLLHAGKIGFTKMIEDDIRLAKILFIIAAEHPELEAISQHLSISTFRYIPKDREELSEPPDYLNELNKSIANRIQAEGEAFISHAVIQNMYCLRVCIVNFRTTVEDIKELVDIVLRIGREVHEKTIKEKI